VDESDASVRALETEIHPVSASYLRVMRVPIQSGRGFLPADTALSMPPVVLSVSAARRFFGTKSAIAGRVVLDGPGARPMQVIGVVRDVRFKSVENEASPALYLLSDEPAGVPRLNTMLFVRSTLSTEATVGALGRAITEASAPLSIAEARTLTSIVREATSSTRFVATLLIGFAATAALLAALGIYGVVSYIISQRRREFGVRLVLGAEGGTLVAATLRLGAVLVGGGAVLGLVAATAAGKLLGAFLYGTGTFDPVTEVLVLILVTLLGLVATFIPARRITRINPADILKI
jgi:putative ABC transport system permease protein